ncbi:uncharacterized protein F5891DRAFT_1059455 [Suillus fuscotomentosus]|uniref:Uncharacterized protein n=1 Tax=Suillus fuscotomentosus TaxID=1912939 RepID=A0AAD4HF36_9AGAM|nr:uncharacterized protein F5891DRAFT_1059455 [Suillus fuscotomentosus]KAG1895305.1 hypothetical protein F5891DRAFT_1059455 [Suillus fuscotomentosus]
MPDATVINNLAEEIHVAFFLGVPTNWKNQLKPGERWTTHLASLPHRFEARSVTESREFSHDESMEMLATIGGACAAGTASVVTGVVGIPASVPLMAIANAGGAKYGGWGAHGRRCITRVWVPLWHHREYSVRMVDGKCVLWEVGANRLVQ